MMCHTSNSSLYFASHRHTPDYITKFASESMGDGVLALSDKKGTVYSQYKVGKSARAKLSGEIDKVRNWDKYKRFFKFSGMKDANMGSRLRPADFLINEDGIIVGSKLGCRLTVGAAVVGTGSANGASTHVKLFADNNT